MWTPFFAVESIGQNFYSACSQLYTKADRQQRSHLTRIAPEIQTMVAEWSFQRFGPLVVHFQGMPTPNAWPKIFGPPTPLMGDMIFQSFVTPKMAKSDFAPADHIVARGKKYVIEIGVF